MIRGIGTDLVLVERIEQALQRHGERFARRILQDSEYQRFVTHRQPARYLAKRFAAKEAAFKALGTGIARGVYWRDMGVVNLPGGKPTMRLTGGAAARLAEILPPGYEALVHLSITDDYPLAQAFVVIEARLTAG